MQGVKRMLTFMQRVFPTDPSRSVDFDGFKDGGRGAAGAGSDKLVPPAFVASNTSNSGVSHVSLFIMRHAHWSIQKQMHRVFETGFSLPLLACFNTLNALEGEEAASRCSRGNSQQLGVAGQCFRCCSCLRKIFV